MNKTQNIIELQKKLNKLLGSEFNSWEMGIYDQGEWVINPFSGVKYYLNGVLVASHLNANSSGNNQYNNFTGDWAMGVCANNVGATMPSSGTTMYSFYMQNMKILKQVT